MATATTVLPEIQARDDRRTSDRDCAVGSGMATGRSSPQSARLSGPSKTGKTTAGALHVGKEMQRVLAPYLMAMVRELKASWPQLEPELMLLHWLCERHQLEPPKMRLRSLAGTGPSKMAPPIGTSLSARGPGEARARTVGASKEASLRRNFLAEALEPLPDSPVLRPLPKKPVALDPLDRSPDSRVSTCDTTGSNLHQVSVDSVPATPCQVSQPSSARKQRDPAADTDAPLQLRVSTFLADRRMQLRQERPEARMFHLNRVCHLVDRDATALADKANSLKDNQDGISLQMAHMRQELRGKFVGSVPLLSLRVLSQQEQFWLVGKLRPWNYEAGDYIVREGDIGDNVFIIERGTCRVLKTMNGRDACVVKLDKGDYFGELSVMYDMPRSATVQCETSVTVLSLSREDIHSTVSEDKWEQMKILARTQVFSSVPFLSKLDTRLKVLLAGRLKTDLWQPGQVLFRENQLVNDSSRRLYIIERGSCSASELGHVDPTKPNTPKRSSSVFLSTAKVHQPGAYFGMLECLYGCSHHITLTAHTEVTTLSISYQELRKLISAEVSAKEAQLVFETMKRCVRAHLIKSVHHSLAIAKPEVLEGVLDTGAITKDYQHWEVILRKGQPLTHICMLEQGTVLQYNGEAESFMANRMSATDCVENSRPGETFETRRMFGQANAAAPYTVIAISKCTIMHIDKESLEALQ